MAVSNNITACLNFLALVCAVPVVVTGIWFASKQGEECARLARWPVAILGGLLLLVALAGSVGTYWNRQGLLAAYLFAMAALITLLLALLVFAFAVTRGSGAYPVPGRAYDDYRLDGFSMWLRGYVADDPRRWEGIRACLAASDTCRKLAQESAFVTPEQRAVLPVRPLAAPVRVLQAADGVRVRVREPDGVDEPGEPGGRPGLRRVEQRPRPALLQLRLLQGWHAGHPARAVAQGQRRARRRHRRAHLRLRHRLQCLQERPDRGPLPPLQVGQRLMRH